MPKRKPLPRPDDSRLEELRGALRDLGRWCAQEAKRRPGDSFVERRVRDDLREFGRSMRGASDEVESLRCVLEHYPGDDGSEAA